MKEITWRKSLEEASKEISGGTRLNLLYFHDPNEEGSRETHGKILKSDRVVDAIERECAPVLINVRENAEMARTYGVDWTPTFIVCDETGHELSRWVGFLPEDDFIAQLLLAKGLGDFHLERYSDAEQEFERLIESHKDSELVPEAEYFLGISKYKETGDQYPLAEACHNLSDKYPHSTWTKRCQVWSHISSPTKKPFVGYDQGGSVGSGAY